MATAAEDLITAADNIVEEILDASDPMDTGGAGAHAPSTGEEGSEDEDEVMESEEDSEGDLLSEDRYNSAGEEVRLQYGSHESQRS